MAGPIYCTRADIPSQYIVHYPFIHYNIHYPSGFPPQHTVFPPTRGARVVDTAFLQHPPNPLWYSLSAFDQKLPRRRKVGDTIRVLIHDEDGNEVNPADVDAEIQWYANGVALLDETDAEIYVSSNMAGAVLSVVVTIDDEKLTDTTKAVAGEDKSAEVELVDDYGLQSDGTGIIGDKLTVTYGADFGTPTNISWYKNGKVVATNSVGDTVNDALSITIPAGGRFGVGTYKVTITNTAGEMATTNEIVITDKEEAAKITGFTLEDDYTDGTDIRYATTDNRAVASVTLNKNYEGRIALYKTNDTSYGDRVDYIDTNIEEPEMTAAMAIGSYTLNNAAVGYVADEASILTTNAASNYQVLNAFNIGAGFGYINDDGTVTYKFVVNDGSLTRGSKYIAVFDQKSITTDTPGRGQENKSTEVAVPYVKSPAAVEVTKAAKSNVPEVTFYDDTAKNTISTWFGYTNDGTVTDQNSVATKTKSALSNLGISSATIYSAKSATTDSTKGTKFAGASKADKTVKGIWTPDTAISNDNSDAFWFAEVKTTAGIYGASSVTITSGNKQTAQDGATDIDILSKKGTPTTAVISLKNVRNAGKVYVVRGYYDVKASGVALTGADAGTYNNVGLNVVDYSGLHKAQAADNAANIFDSFNKDDPTTYVEAADVAVGQAEVEIENAISNVSTNKITTPANGTAQNDVIDGVTLKAGTTGNGDDTQIVMGKKYVNTYIAVFIPNDTTNYGTVYTDSGLAGSNSTADGTGANKSGLTVTQALTSYKLFSDADAKVAVKSAYNVSATDTIGSNDAGNAGDLYMAAYDQFGDNMLHVTNVAQADVSLEPVKSSFNGDPSAAITGIKIKTTDAATKAAGKVTLTTGTIATTLAPLKLGNQLSAGLRTGQTITLTVTKGDSDGKIAFGVSIS